jgi:hypothetical protein
MLKFLGGLSTVVVGVVIGCVFSDEITDVVGDVCKKD